VIPEQIIFISRGITVNHQLDATISPVYYPDFIYSSVCFERPHAHHQELNCSSSLWSYLRSVVIAVLLVVVRHKVEKLLHLVGDLFELYDDARTCKL